MRVGGDIEEVVSLLQDNDMREDDLVAQEIGANLIYQTVTIVEFDSIQLQLLAYPMHQGMVQRSKGGNDQRLVGRQRIFDCRDKVSRFELHRSELIDNDQIFVANG